MPITPEFYKSALEKLSTARPITARKMFGGAGVYIGNSFIAVIDDDKVFFKVDEYTRAAYETEGMGPWSMGGQIDDNYRELPTNVLNDPEALGEWIDGAVEVVRRKESEKKR